ncbi:MAG: hypothetical protein ABIV26_06405, partial [Candidatus Limnocylindrales bacterium]
PHCGTPQAETARCWVCRRSSTTCSTCRQFRPSVAGQLGYCGLDKRHLPLVGTELRGCWAGAPTRSADAPEPRPADPVEDAAVAAFRFRDFVPVELDANRTRTRRGARTRIPASEPAADQTEIAIVPGERQTLFADGEL